MNAALQCLLHTTELSHFFLRGFYRRYLNDDVGRKQVVESFRDLVDEMHTKHGRLAAFATAPIVDPKKFKSCLGGFKNKFRFYLQEDCHELLEVVLDCIHEGLNKVKEWPQSPPKFEIGNGDPSGYAELANSNWSKYKSTDDSIIKDIFRGQLSRTFTCCECNHASVTWDPFECLPVEFGEHCGNPTCFADMLHAGFFQPGEQIRKYCENCKTERSFATKIGIWRAPEVLIVQLKRFKAVAEVDGKFSQARIDTHVDVPLGIVDFEQYFDMNSPIKSQSPSAYRLYAICNHIGAT